MCEISLYTVGERGQKWDEETHLKKRKKKNPIAGLGDKRRTLAEKN